MDNRRQLSSAGHNTLDQVEATTVVAYGHQHFNIVADMCLDTVDRSNDRMAQDLFYRGILIEEGDFLPAFPGCGRIRDDRTMPAGTDND
jgi:hypothetical protein